MNSKKDFSDLFDENFEVTYDAVSYTHLDVYKRQPSPFPELPGCFPSVSVLSVFLCSLARR